MVRDEAKVRELKTRANAQFRKLDTDKDNLLDFKEMGGLLRSGNPNFSDRELRALFQSIDKDGSGKLSVDEFIDHFYPPDDVDGPPAAAVPVPQGVRDAFTSYCDGKPDMDGKSWVKLCKDTGLVDRRGFSPTDCDLIFAKVVNKGDRRIQLPQFERALGLVAAKKGCNVADVYDKVEESNGPVLNATKADSVRFHDDKGSYTGAHVGRQADGDSRRAASPGPSRRAASPGPAARSAGGAPSRGRPSGGPSAAAPSVNSAWLQSEGLQLVFTECCGRDGDMDGREFAKLCKDAQLYDKAFKSTDADLIFAKSVTRGSRKIGFTQFRDALQLIADKKGWELAQVESVVGGSGGPSFCGTKTDEVKFHDDASMYTGAHRGK